MHVSGVEVTENSCSHGGAVGLISSGSHDTTFTVLIFLRKKCLSSIRPIRSLNLHRVTYGHRVKHGGPVCSPALCMDLCPGQGSWCVLGWKGRPGALPLAVDSFLDMFSDFSRIVELYIGGVRVPKSKPPRRILWFLSDLAGLFDFNMSVFFKIDFSFHFFNQFTVI